MDRIRHVLVLPGNTEVGFEIWRSLKNCRNVRLSSACCEVPSHADLVYGKSFFLPDVNREEWVEPLERLIRDEAIDYVYPAYDDVVLALAGEASRIPAGIITSPLETCEVTRSKVRTYHRYEGWLPVPRIYDDVDSVESYPVFVKPDIGQGSQNAVRIDNRASLIAALDNIPGLFIMENINGPEFTVDCFSDRERGILFVGGRQRIRTRSGISMNSRPVEDPRFARYAEIIADRLAFHGAWFFQVKESSGGELYLLEVSPRISGTMATHRVTGINFPLLSILEHERAEYDISPERVEVEIERALINRYRHDIDFTRVYVDLDDTLIVEGRVNWELAGFLYQCLNRGCRLVIISRSEQVPADILARHRLLELFDEVIHVEPAGKKADHMDPEGAIFIDDSYSERMSARDAGMKTFDCSMIEMLFDYRS